mgnify:CR=1 FL=1
MKFLVASQVCNVAPLGNPASQRTAFSDGVGGPEEGTVETTAKFFLDMRAPKCAARFLERKAEL